MGDHILIYPIAFLDCRLGTKQSYTRDHVQIHNNNHIRYINSQALNYPIITYKMYILDHGLELKPIMDIKFRYISFNIQDM